MGVCEGDQKVSSKFAREKGLGAKSRGQRTVAVCMCVYIKGTRVPRTCVSGEQVLLGVHARAGVLNVAVVSCV
jgi:hypothetical protein